MTIEEFNKTGFGPTMKVIYRDGTHNVIGVNFYEKLIELECEFDESLWARCENVEFI